MRDIAWRPTRSWQRGIALYYAGRYKDCRLQFESHRTVNPNDVETVREHARRGGFPADVVVTVAAQFGPETANS
jgi:hypothetical protein